MLTKSGSVCMPCGAVAAPVNSCCPAEHILDQWEQDSAVVALLAEVDAILCAAAARLIPHCRPPAPPVTGWALRGPRSAGRFWVTSATRWDAPHYPVRAVQRSPPSTVLYA